MRQTGIAPGAVRRLVLGGAFVAALATLAAAPAPHATRADALPDVIASARAADTPQGSPPAAGPPADAESAPDATIKGGHHGIVIEKGGKKIRVEGLFTPDREYDSFAEFMQDAPWLAGAFFATMLVLFLVPILIVALLVWYKLRKNRLANETMLKLAERGVVPPPAAMEAVATGTTAASVAAAGAALEAAPAPGVPAYEHARLLHRRAVWSDLRKGVILTAIGLGLNFWAMADDGTANGLGIILLFVGLGYCLLWFFEERNAAASRGAPPAGRAP